MAQILSLGAGAIVMVAATQFPEYSQQYVQRLGGAVDELRTVAADFDTSASKVGLDREAALASMTGNAFQQARQADMSRTFSRLERLEADLADLKDANAIERAGQALRFSDRTIAARAWDDFRPGVPLTFEGLVFALGGFIAGFVLFGGVLRLLSWPFRAAKRGNA